MTRLGEQLGAGRTSEVFAYGHGSVVKLLRLGVPQRWADQEARFTTAVMACGCRVPEVQGLVEIDGRQGIVLERIVGPTMWQAMLDRPDDAAALARELASVHRIIQESGIPAGIPDLIGRLCAKIRDAERLAEANREEACALAESLPRGATLLHGDLHPGNVMISSEGPVVIDWYDAAIGHPVADVVRSSILLRRPLDGWLPRHLPGATPEMLDTIHDAYRSQFEGFLDAAVVDLRVWEPVVAAGRMAEGVDGEEATLAAIWATRIPG